MICEENKTRWKRGDIVIHDADAKDHKMLMVVLAADDTGLTKSQYFNLREIVPDCIIRKYGSFANVPVKVLKEYMTVWENDLKYLHDPARFGIEITDKDKENAINFMVHRFYYNRS